MIEVVAPGSAPGSPAGALAGRPASLSGVPSLLSGVPSLCSHAALAVGVAVLALSLAAKLAGRDETLAIWPVTGVARRFAGPAQVTAIEALVVAAMAVPLPVPPRLVLIGAVFTAYALAAAALRGRRCACFGAWVPARFTWRHAAACAAVAAAACCGLPGGEPPGAGSADAAAGLLLAVPVAAWLRRRARAAAGGTGIPAEIDHIVIFTAESCGFCAALEAQRRRYEAMTDRPVEFRRAESQEDARAAGGVFPAAVAYDTAGLPVAGPAHGLAGIRDLLRRGAPRSARTTEARVDA
ncbi:MAG TPA: hypothetical protein VF069_28835 [Streptosporangiaceae bacterium]